MGVAKDFCGFVVEEKIWVFEADAFECVNRKSLVENVFKTEENYITFGKAFVIFAGVQGRNVKDALVIARPQRKMLFPMTCISMSKLRSVLSFTKTSRRIPFAKKSTPRVFSGWARLMLSI